MSFFSEIQMLPEDPILKLNPLYNADQNPNKVNLGIGAYRDEKGLSVVLPSVKKADELIQMQNLNKEYQPIQGDASFLKGTLDLIFGSNRAFEKTGAIQTIGATNALRLGGDFLHSQGYKHIFLPDITWSNHHLLFECSGFKTHSYPYYDQNSKTIKFDELIKFLEKLQSDSVVLFQACCHNPTGVDFNHEQWKVIAEIVKRKKLFSFFDLAYQGFGKSFEEDVFCIRYFSDLNIEFFVANSYSKNMGLYGERIGSILWHTKDQSISSRLLSHMKHFVRASYSTPPLYSARIVSTIINSKELFEMWQREVNHMRERILHIRQLLKNELSSKLSIDLSFMDHQCGMFSMLGFNEQEVEELQNIYGIYMPYNGRICVPGLNEFNLEYVVDAFSSILHKKLIQDKIHL